MAKLDTEVHEHQPANQPNDTEHSPVVISQLKKRADDWQLHLADQITSFAGSMPFVWVHVAIFAFWVATGLFGADPYPFQFLTFMVSLEAIFLSTFVMIGQNRQSTFQQAKADRDFHEAERELKRNTELTRSVHAITRRSTPGCGRHLRSPERRPRPPTHDTGLRDVTLNPAVKSREGLVAVTVLRWTWRASWIRDFTPS